MILVRRLVLPPDPDKEPQNKNSSNNDKQKEIIADNFGKKIDITPSNNHKLLKPGENPGYIGEPNSSVDLFDRTGEFVTRRWFDKNGRATRDVDMTFHRNLKKHPRYPHEHFWKYDKDGNLISRE